MNHTDFLRYQAESVKRANLPPVPDHSGRGVPAVCRGRVLCQTVPLAVHQQADRPNPG